MDIMKFVLLLLFGLRLADSIPNSCITSRGKPGDITRVRNCPKMLRILSQLNHTNEETEYLHNILDEETKPVYVCCEVDEEGIRILNQTENFNSCGTFSGSHIVANGEIGVHSRPWLALFKLKNERIILDCGGTLITKRFVLTAASCFLNRNVIDWFGGKHLEVRLGEHHLNETGYCSKDLNTCEKGYVDIDVEETIFHEDFYTSGKDIALVKLAWNVEYSEHIRPICLPLSQELRNLGQAQNAFEVTSWATLENVGVPVPSQAIVFRTNCLAKLDKIIGFCTRGGFNGNCIGYSGDPLTLSIPYYGTRRFVQFGIVRKGKLGCDLPSRKRPKMHIDVADFISWISRNIIE